MTRWSCTMAAPSLPQPAAKRGVSARTKIDVSLPSVTGLSALSMRKLKLVQEPQRIKSPPVVDPRRASRSLGLESVGVGTYNLATAPGAECVPHRVADGGLDEPDRPVCERHVDSPGRLEAAAIKFVATDQGRPPISPYQHDLRLGVTLWL